MIRCPQCGTDNLDGSEYCDECGYQLSAMRGAPTSGALLQGGMPSAPPQTTPPAAVPPRGQVSYEVVSPAGARPTPPSLSPADFSPPPPNVPSIAVAPQPHSAPPATSPAADVFAVSPPPVPPPIPSPAVASSLSATPPPVMQGHPAGSAAPTAVHQPTPPPQIHSPGSPPATPSASPPASPSVPRAKLVIQRGGTVGKEFLLTETESNIGRWDADGGIFPDVDLDQDDPEAKVSRRHARILCQDGQYLLEDLGSTNGTFVNRGRRLLPGNRHPLNDGDEIIVGKTFLKFHYIR